MRGHFNRGHKRVLIVFASAFDTSWYASLPVYTSMRALLILQSEPHTHSHLLFRLFAPARFSQLRRPRSDTLPSFLAPFGDPTPLRDIPSYNPLGDMPHPPS